MNTRNTSLNTGAVVEIKTAKKAKHKIRKQIIHVNTIDLNWYK
jgi:hypothetical protein